MTTLTPTVAGGKTAHSHSHGKGMQQRTVMPPLLPSLYPGGPTCSPQQQMITCGGGIQNARADLIAATNIIVRPLNNGQMELEVEIWLEGNGHSMPSMTFKNGRAVDFLVNSGSPFVIDGTRTLNYSAIIEHLKQADAPLDIDLTGLMSTSVDGAHVD